MLPDEAMSDESNREENAAPKSIPQGLKPGVF
jgi:hypothetical protein